MHVYYIHIILIYAVLAAPEVDAKYLAISPSLSLIYLVFNESVSRFNLNKLLDLIKSLLLYYLHTVS